MENDTVSLETWLTTQASGRRFAPGLNGLKGRLLLQVRERTVATLVVQDGAVEMGAATGKEDAILDFTDEKTMIAMLAAELHPVVAFLQGRLRTEGDLIFATKAMLGLQVGKPFGPAQGG